MFVIPIYVRFALMAVGIVGGIALWAAYGFWYGFFFLLAGIILAIGYFLLGTVQSAALLMNEGKMAEAEARLKLTFFPNLLFYANRSYYYMLHGTIAMQKKDFNGAEKWVQKAMATGMATDNEKAMAYLQLANLAAAKSNWTAAQNHLNEAKKLNVTEGMIKDQLKELDKAMKQRGQAMNPSIMGMMGKGGFRAGSKKPRPPVR